MFESLMDVGVSDQDEDTDISGEYLILYIHVWCIDGRGCVRPRGSFGPKGGITCIFSMFKAFMDVDVGVSSQGADTDLRG